MAMNSLANVIQKALVQRVLVPALALVLVVTGLSVWSQKRNAERLNILLAETMARYVGNFVSESFAVLGGMEDLAAQGDMKSVASQMLQLRRISPNFDRLLLVDRARRVVLTEPAGREGVDFSIRFDNVEGRNLVLSRPIFAHPSRKIVIYIGRHLEKGGLLLIAELNLESLATHLSNLMTEERSRIIVTDAFGNVIVHPDRRLVETQANIGDSPLFKVSSEGGNSVVFKSGARYVLGTAAVIPELGWRVFVERPAGHVFTPALVPLIAVFGFMGILLAFFTVLLRREFAERIVAPMTRLTEALKRVGESGHAEFPRENAFGELTALRQGLEDMAARIADRERLLVEGELRFRAIFEQAAVGIAQCSPDGVVMRINRRYCDITGYGQENLRGVDIRDIIHPEDRDTIEKSLGRILSGEEATSTIEIRYLRAEGEPVWVNITLSSQRNIAGELVSVIGVVQDISDRKRAEEALRENESKYRTLFDQAQDMIMLVDAESGIFLDCNREAEEVLGWPKSEIVGRHQSALHPAEEHDGEMSVAFRGYMGEKRGELVESRIMTSEGEILDVAVKGNTFELSGRKVILGVYRDVTEAKRAAERIQASLLEKEVLLREVHHRVKNNLQIISGLLYLQSEAGASPEAAEMFAMSRNRISSMALVHEEIYRSDDFSGVNLKNYVTKLLPRIVNTFMGSKKFECLLDVEEVWVNIDKAVPFGLILNEIVTNAAKHAFPGRGDGRMTVSIKEKDGTLEAVVEDNGVGLPDGFDPERSQTLGMQLIANLARQLKGTLRVESEGGTRFSLEVPL